jgi:predicted outer membrane repeat protein
MTYLGQTDGGAIFCLMSSPTLRNCVFENNSATYAGAIYVDQGNPEVASCTFRGNTAATYGGAIAGPNSRPSIHDCLFENNYAGTGDGTIHVAFDSPIARCVFRNNEARSGAAINSGGASAAYRIQDCIFIGNRAHGQHGGAIRIHEANALVERCLFVDNSAALDGGAIIVIDGANPQIVNCTFDRNGAGRVGGTIAIWTDSAPAISNCIIANTTGNAGVYCVESYPLFSCDDAWRNAGGNYAGECSDPTGTSGNIAQDPLFCDPPGLDYGIAENSPCAPAHNPYCGLIGAYDVACNGPTPVASMTWGGVKAMFR